MDMSLEIKENVVLAPFTTFNIGGPAEYFAVVRSEEEAVGAFAWAKTRSLPLTVLSGGTNVLIAQKGVKGLVLKNEIRSLDLREENGKLIVVAGSGYPYAALGIKTATMGYTGLEFAATIPGMVGGAVVGNAGAYGRETKDALTSLRIVQAQGDTTLAVDIPARELAYSYRESRLKREPWIVVTATFMLARAEQGQSPLERIEESRLRRKETQPVGVKCEGCFFKNATPSQEELSAHPELRSLVDSFGRISAGRLLDLAGAKALRVGGASVSSLHANFVISEGATADETIALVRRMRALVQKRFGVTLENEVRLIGFPFTTL